MNKVKLGTETIDAITKLSNWLRSETFKDSLNQQRIRQAIYYSNMIKTKGGTNAKTN